MSNVYFKPIEWDLDDYLSFQDLGKSLYNPVDLNEYIRYISPEIAEEISSDVSSDQDDIQEDKPKYVFSIPSPLGGFIYQEIPKGGEIKIDKSETKGKSSISTSFATKEDFKRVMLPLYQKVLSDKGLNPTFARSLVAQDGLESAWGKKPSGSNNFGGIKGNGTSLKTREVINGRDIYVTDSFRDFDSLEDYARYKVDLLNNKRYRAFSGDVSEFSSRVSHGGYATDPRYKEVLEKVIKSVRKGGILKAQNGVLLSKYNTPGDWYDYSDASDVPSGDDHWYSRNTKTGLLLKHPNHDTYREMLKAEKRMGNRLFEDMYGREYSFNETEAMTKGMMPGMKEKSYPADLFTKDAKSLYGPKLSIAKRYYNKLKGLGAGDVQAAAMVGVFMKESSLNHNSVSSKGAKGVAQLLGDKYDDYQEWLIKNRRADTAENQIEWVWDHMSFGKDY